MEQYIGTKIIYAEPMEKNGRDGYKVVYAPDGYESWSPKDVFEAAYRPTTGVNFGLAIEAAKQGARIARHGWNGKGMYVFLTEVIEFHTDADLSEFEDQEVPCADLLAMRTARGDIQPGWLASQVDILADDWYIVE